MPTRNARNGMLFTRQGIINIKNEKWKDDFSPIDEESSCEMMRTHSKAFLRHLVHSGEILGAQISSINNLSLYCWLTADARNKIIEGTFQTWKKETSEKLMRRL
jgi:queuine tRNA-ribosyltransferase